MTARLTSFNPALTTRRAAALFNKQAAPNSEPGKVIKIDADNYQVGRISICRSSRETSFDARLNQDGGPIEYLLVTKKGKVHEALFSSDVRPLNLNVAFMLLGYKPSPELFEIRTPDHKPTVNHHEVPAHIKTLARIRILADWQTPDGGKSCPVNQLIVNRETGGTMEDGPCLYTGSLVTEAGYRAEQTGDIMAVFNDPTAMVNHPGPSASKDDIWSVNPTQLPAKGSALKIRIKPFSCNDTTDSEAD